MPIVPVTEGPQVATRPLPDVRAPLETFGGGSVARPVDLSGLRDAAVSIWQDEKRKADQVAVLDVAGKVSDLETTLAQQTRQRLGKNAFTAPEDVHKAWTDGISEMAKGLHTDEQRLAFNNLVQSHWRELNGTVQSHVAQQRKVYDDDAYQFYLKTEGDAAISNFHDPLRVDLSIKNRQAATEDFARRNGLPDEWVQAKKLDIASGTHVGIIDRLLANDQDLAAKKYYDQVKDQVEGPAKIQVERALEEGGARGESQKQADAILAKTSTLTEAVAEVRKIQDPKVRDLAEDRVRREFVERDKAAREQAAADMGRATNIVEQTHDVNRIPPDIFLRLPIGDRKELRSYAESLQKGIPVSKEVDSRTFNDLMGRASSEDGRDKFLTEDLVRYRGRLTDAHFDHLVELQASMRKGDTAAEEKLGHFRTQEQVIASSLSTAYGKKRIQDVPNETVDAFTREVEAQRQQFEQEKGKPATTVEVQKIVDGLLIRGATQQGMFSDDTKRAFELLPGEKLTLRYKDIPASEAARIRQQLAGHLPPSMVTDDEVLRVYRTKLSQRSGVFRPAEPIVVKP